MNRPRFKGRPQRQPGSMNKTEQAFAEYLELRKRAGEITWWKFEPLKLRLAKRTFYTPDFAALRPDGSMVIYEVKGFWEDDARVKIKAAAEQFWMFDWIAVTKKRGCWQFEAFGETGKIITPGELAFEARS